MAIFCIYVLVVAGYIYNCSQLNLFLSHFQHRMTVYRAIYIYILEGMQVYLQAFHCKYRNAITKRMEKLITVFIHTCVTYNLYSFLKS